MYINALRCRFQPKMKFFFETFSAEIVKKKAFRILFFIFSKDIASNGGAKRSLGSKEPTDKPAIATE